MCKDSKKLKKTKAKWKFLSDKILKLSNTVGVCFSTCRLAVNQAIMKQQFSSFGSNSHSLPDKKIAEFMLVSL